MLNKIFIILVIVSCNVVFSQNKNAFDMVKKREDKSVYRLFLPSFPQWQSERYFRASVIDLGMAWFIMDFYSFRDITDSRKGLFDVKKRMFESLAQSSSYLVGKNIKFENFEPDTFVKYSNDYGKDIVLNAYSDAIASEYRYIQGKNQKYIDAVWLSAIFSYSFFDGYGAFNHRNSVGIDPFDAFFRSLILPGWGQLSTESYTQAATIYLLAIGFGGQAYFLNREADYLKSTKLYIYNNVTALRVIKKRNSFLFYLLGLYAYNLVDAFVEAKLYNVHMDLSYEINDKNLDFGVKLLF